MANEVKDEMSKYELTAEQVLKMYGVRYPEYKAEKKFNTGACNKEATKHKNVQVYEWVLYKKTGKTYVEVKSNDRTALLKSTGTAINQYAIGGENGIIINKPLSLAKDKQLGNPQQISSGSASNASLEDSSGTFDVGTGSFEYEVIGYSGEDEKIIKQVSFIKKCLLKETYEFIGEIL